MKKFILSFLLIHFGGHLPTIFSQTNNSFTDTTKKNLNFLEIDEQFNALWKDKKPNMLVEEYNAEEGGWQQYERWAHFMEQRTLPSGNMPNPNILWNEWNAYKNIHKKNKTASFTGNWSFIGPDFVPSASSSGGTGRINCIVFDPTNSNTIWLGTPDGGLWKSTDAGSTWSTNTDLLTNLGISDIAIDPTNTQNMLIVTGDKFGYDDGTGNFWGGTYSAGILKSTDGGITWNATSLTYAQTQYTTFQRVIIIPDYPNIVLAVASDGIWRSTDSGSNWTKIKTGTYYDLELNPGNSSISYTANKNSIYKSTDYGQTWSLTYTTTSTADGRVSLAVTDANSSVLYAWFENGYLYKSSDEAVTFQAESNPSNNYTFYGYYDMALTACPTNENMVFIGGLDIYKSTNSGSSWTQMSHWSNTQTSPKYAHADHHCLTFLPGSGTEIYTGNDGGIFKSTNTGSAWTDLSQGIGITQLYSIASAATDPYLIYMGAQDNGSLEYDNGTTTSVYGGDGMDCMADYSDPTISYVSLYYGSIYQSTDGGNNYYDISPFATGAWVTPFVMDPKNHNTLYGGYDQVYKTTNAGNNWNSISASVSLGSSLITSLAVAQSNTKYIYFATLSKIYVTKDGGSTWTSIKSGLPVTYLSISGITISHTDPEKVWITFSGYGSGEKVYYSDNAGTSWTNISGSLPNIPFNCVTYQDNSNDQIYVGSDFGVYYINKSMSDWTYFNTGLPNVIISELEINDGIKKIRAATYGRGIWESDLADTTGDTITVYTDFTASLTTIYEGDAITFTDLTTGNPSAWSWTFTGASPSSSTSQNPSSIKYKTAGTYNVSLYASHGNKNDTESKTSYITVLADTASSSSIFEKSSITDLFIFPNPTNGIFEINITLKKMTQTNLSIYNALGSVVYTNNLGPTKGDDYYIDLSNQAKGVYYLKINTEKESVVRKIVLQ